MNREQINVALFQLLQSKLSTVTISNEPVVIPASPYQYSVNWNTRFVGNVSVVDTNGVVFTNIGSGTPSTNQYVVDSTGNYTFAAADVGRSVLITYTFTGIITASRRLSHWNDVMPADQPAMYLVKKSEKNEKKRGVPDKWIFNFELYVYVNTTNDPNVIPTSLMNPILDEITNMFAPDDLANDALTLGGLVSHVAVNGELITDEGVLGDQAITIVPIEILVPS